MLKARLAGKNTALSVYVARRYLVKHRFTRYFDIFISTIIIAASKPLELIFYFCICILAVNSGLPEAATTRTIDVVLVLSLERVHEAGGVLAV